MKKLNTTIATLLTIIIAAILINSCKEELPEAPTGVNNKVTLTLTTDSISYTFSDFNFGINYIPELKGYETGICFDTLAEPTIDKAKTIINTLSNLQTMVKANNLLPLTTYYARAYFKFGESVLYSSQTNWQTLDARPIFQTQEIDEINALSAKIKVMVTAPIGFDITKRGVCWATLENPDLSDNFTANGLGSSSYISEITKLDTSKAYFVRAYATNTAGTTYGEQLNLTTLNGKSELTSLDITDITATTAISGGNITFDGGDAIISRGVCWAISSKPTIADSKTVNGNGTGSWASELTNLSVNTTYYVRAYATNRVETTYSAEKTFATLDGLPVITTNSIAAITATTATCGGNITNDGGFIITARGICWSTSSNPTTADNKTIEGTGAGSFTSTLTGLTMNTTYYVRAYATNSAGTVYGSEKTFTTLDGLPTVTTNSMAAITATSATCGGNITDDGGFAITARGVCWSASNNPTTDGNKTTDGNSTGSFTSSISNLSASTTYYVRAYATNEIGTSYGSQHSFKTLRDGEGYFTDKRDNNVYRYVTIGTQVWMAENLAFLPEVSPVYSGGYSTPYYYVYGYSGSTVSEAIVSANYKTYGALYNWAAANESCPAGWHLPTDEEWKTLEIYLGMSQSEADAIGWRGSLEGKKLKALNGWNSSGNGTDNYGFTAFPAGARYDGALGGTSSFGSIGELGRMWSATAGSSTMADYRSLSYLYVTINRSSGRMEYGFSVRCIKD